MIVNVPTLEELVERMWAAVSTATGLTDRSESGVTYNIVKACAVEALTRWETLARVEQAHDFTTATGSDLETIGQMFGVYRKNSMRASTLSSPRPLKFTNNGGTTAAIPIGTRVWDPQSPEISYFTTALVSISPGNQAYINATAPYEGTYYNVGANRLVSHNAPVASVSVTNEIPITSGTDTETDESYRARIQQSLLRYEGPNPTSVRLALMAVPGVRNVTLLPFARGTGTIDALIEGYDTIIPTEVVSACQSVMDETVAAGISAKVRAPELVYVDITVQVRLTPTGDFQGVRSSISEATRGYIDNLPIETGDGNAVLYMAELSARIQESSPDILTSKTTLTVNGIPALTADQRLQFGQKFASQAVVVS